MAEARLDRIEMLLEKMAMSMTSQNPSPGGSQHGGANYSAQRLPGAMTTAGWPVCDDM